MARLVIISSRFQPLWRTVVREPAVQRRFAMGQRSWQSCCLLLAWVAALSWAAGDSLAQDTPTSPKPGTAESVAPPSAEQILPGEVLPKVYVLKDKDGNFQAMPGFSLEQFMETWKAKNQIGRQNQPPRYSIQKLALSGSASRERAELVAVYTITVLEAGWVGVPLRLNDAIVREPSYEGPGEHVLRYDQREGYVVWIRGAAGKTHHMTLKVLAGVIQTGPESRLRLNVARAVESQMRLQVPVERALATVSEGSTLESTRTVEGGRTELTVAGVGGEFDVSWHSAEVQVAALPSALEVTGTMFVRINGRSVNTDAKLVVRSLGGEFDRFQVRLPPGADNVGSVPAGMSLVPIDTASAKGKLYEVKLDKKIVGPLELPLVTERIHDSPRADELLELAGFEIVGAVRQSGVIAIKVEGNWQAVWGETNHVVQVEDLADVPRRDELTAGFEYFAQPFSLTAHVVPQRTRVRVQGEYVLSIGSEDAQLSAKLKYTIRGAKIRTLEVEMPGWEVDAVGPGNLVNVDAAVASQGDPLLVPLLQATSGELELTLEAHRKISHDAGGVALEIPRPRAEAVMPADVAVVPADNIELAFEADQTTDLAPQTTRPQIKLPERLQDPLFFRTEGPAAKFAASIKVHEQAISASQSAQLDVEEPQTQVDERIVFRIAYEPADHLMLSVPRAIRADRLSITLDGQRLIGTPTRERAGEPSEMVPMRVALPSPRIGRCELQIRYTVRHDKPANVAKAPVSIPLVIAGEGQVTTNELVVVPKPGITVSYPAGGPWSEDPRNPQAANAQSLALSARRALAEVALVLNFKERPAASATTIGRAWIQTRLTDVTRQDRAVYRFTTSEPRIQLTLPPGADMGLLELEIDSRRAVPDAINQSDVTVSLPGTVGGEHLLELRYHFAERPPSGSLALAPVQFKSANWVQQFYWQLIVPAHEHVLVAPAHFTREFRWAWSDFFWQRQPSWEQRDLESWNGAAVSAESARLADETPEQFAARQKIAARATNRYLFSTVGTIEPLEIYTSSRARLVFWASLPLLLCGLALIYFPLARHPALLFALGVLVAAGSFVDPDSALLFAQAATLGMALVVTAALLARFSARSPVPTTPVRGSSKALVERGATEIYHRAAAHSSQPSTATDPLMSATSGEAES
jgi:hypothetical protein